MKGYIKTIMAGLGLEQLANLFSYQIQRMLNRNSNIAFQNTHPEIGFPPDYLLYETGKVNFVRYYSSGKEAAKEIASLYAIFGQSPAQTILDWGCGTGRVTRHLPGSFPDATIIGADANPACIEWLQHTIPTIQWVQSNTDYTNPQLTGQFNLIIGISVLTHLPAADQAGWLATLHKLLYPQALAWLSTHGDSYLYQLTAPQQRQLAEKGVLTLGADKKGSRQMRTYHSYAGMQALLGQDWEIILYYNGKQFPGVLGGQDAWLLKKLR